jgi:hypothetical protein
MSFNLKSVLDLCPTLKKEQNYILSEKEATQLEPKYLISLDELKSYKSDFKGLITNFQSLINKITFIDLENQQNENDKDYKRKEYPKEFYSTAYDLVVKGVKSISTWKTAILEQCAWKYSHPAPIDRCQLDAHLILKLEEEKEGIVNEDQTKDLKDITIGEYERVVRFNYTKEERAILVEMISMIKSAEKIMITNASKLLPLIRNVIYKDLQIFIQLSINDMISKLKKNKKAQGLK